MQIKVGTDLIEVERIRNSIKKYKNKFLNRIYTGSEQEYCEKKNSEKYQYYAARFAVKEAAFKAVSDLLESKYSISWKDIEVVNNESGKPSLKFNCNFDEIISIDVSISHVKEFATATVVILCK